ncbi:EAL domain-containing protein [Marinibaculum pumilum]|uniref:EAL domain-containing protein n=1 Tax=Marinibaculum pumilum TaxID=1766165 RepID=A0ABV7L7F1_9PROT
MRDIERIQRPATLIVEDDDFQRRTLVRMVRRLDNGPVLEARDGVEALRFLEDKPHGIGLILCDLDMPNMDGLELVRHLDRSGGRTGLAITSAQDPQVLSSAETMCLAYGIEPLGILRKPILPRHVEDLVRKNAARHGTPCTTGCGGRAHCACSTPATASGPEPIAIEEILEGLAEHQFVPFFQPKVALEDGQVVGVEALARWQHPQRGTIGPGAFIAQMEEAGRIGALTATMLHQAAAARRRWQDAGIELTVSVNLSQISLASVGLADRVTDIICTAGSRPQDVILEITETAAMTEVGLSLENLTRLRMRGFGLSIDDFGTGYAGMQQLGRVPFSELKIDRGYVSGMHCRRDARAIVDASIGIARRMGMTCVAEGIETAQEWEALREAGCDVAQGYYMARPLAEDALLAFCLERL